MRTDWRAVQFRVGATSGDQGLAIPYVTATYVMNCLDKDRGTNGWMCDFRKIENTTICRLSIWSGTEWIPKENGAGDTDIEAEKGALSDAFKRAAVMWGYARDLYNFPQVWVALDGNRIADHELERLRGIARDHLGGGEERVSSPEEPVAAEPTAGSNAHVGEIIQAAESVAGKYDVPYWVPLKAIAGKSKSLEPFPHPPDDMMIRKWIQTQIRPGVVAPFTDFVLGWVPTSDGPGQAGPPPTPAQPPEFFRDKLRFGKFKGKSWQQMYEAGEESDEGSWIGYMREKTRDSAEKRDRELFVKCDTIVKMWDVNEVF